MTPLRETTVVKVVSSFGEAFVHIVVGLFFMAGGAWLVNYGLQHPVTSVANGVTIQALNKPIVIGGGLTALLGALVMPTIFPLFKQIVVFVVPYAERVPVVGSLLRRSTDVPPPGGPPT